MQLILKPLRESSVGESNLAEIVVTDSVFPVGRHEEPFAGYPRDLVAKLSKRHARIFEEHGKVYVADLGSTNGTTLNGVEVGRTPLELQRGDELCFTKLCYEVELLGGGLAQADSAPTVKVSLVLTPENAQAGLEPIVVSHFPFLVSRDGNAFAKFKASHPDQLGFISRRHAHLFLKGNEVFIEDLGAINGTYLEGVRLEEHSHAVADGARVAFGGDHFVYRVHVLRPDEDTVAGDADTDAVVLTGTLAALEDPTRTTFITSPDSFIDIYYREDGAGVEANEADEPSAESETVSPLRLRLRRVGQQWRDLRAALGGDAPSRPLRRWVALGVLLAGGGVMLGWYLYNAPVREIETCMAGEDYECAASLARGLLERRGEDANVLRYSVAAVVQHTVPQWVDALAGNDFALAERQLREGRDLAAFTPPLGAYLDFLDWATALELFIAHRGDADAPLHLFKEEATIEALVGQWDDHKQSYQRSAGEIERRTAVFQPVSLRINSHRATLAAKLDAEVIASQRLDALLKSTLADGKMGEIDSALDRFSLDYPAVRGVDDVRAEIALYSDISSDVTNGRWLAAKQKLEVTTFVTPALAEAANVLRTELPPESVAGDYGAAFDAWRSGDLAECLEMLDVLADGEWGAIAQRERSRRRAILTDFEALATRRGDKNYGRDVLALYRNLDLDQDRYITTQLATDYEAAVADTLAKAAGDFGEAQRAWEQYQSRGPISSEDRTAKSVTARFKSLAALLRLTHTRSVDALGGYALARIAPTKSTTELSVAVNSEICAQRDIMNDWRDVDPSYETKLDLLPDADCGG